MGRGERKCGIFIQWTIIQPLKRGNSPTWNNLDKPGRHYSEKSEKRQSHNDKYYMISLNKESDSRKQRKRWGDGKQLFIRYKVSLVQDE